MAVTASVGGAVRRPAAFGRRGEGWNLKRMTSRVCCSVIRFSFHSSPGPTLVDGNQSMTKTETRGFLQRSV